MRELADDLGYEWRGVYYWFDQIASAREFARKRMRLERDIHEDAAFHDCAVIFNTKGRAPD